MKFRVGDRVRFVKSTIRHTNDVRIGEIYKIIARDSTDVPYKVENREWFREDELELVTTTFKKSDLQDDDIVTYRDGIRRRVRKNKLLNEDGYSGNRLENYNNDLKDKDGERNLDIVKVERPTKYETVFERKEEILDNTEKNYLRSVIRPFRNEVKTIEKNIMDDKEYICINLKNWLDTFTLPRFKKGTMYKGMKKDKKYTLEELGL